MMVYYTDPWKKGFCFECGELEFKNKDEFELHINAHYAENNRKIDKLAREQTAEKACDEAWERNGERR